MALTKEEIKKTLSTYSHRELLNELLNQDKAERQTWLNNCQDNFDYFFFNYCFTSTDDGQCKKIPDTYTFLTDLYKRWNVPDTPTCDVKSAQNLITWLSASTNLHDILFKRNIDNCYISIGQFESSKVKDRVQFLIDNLPEWFLPLLGLKQTGESKTQIEFTKNGKEKSAIIFLHSGEKSGRSLTFYRSTLDEFGFQRNAKKIYEGIKGRTIYLNIFSTPSYSKAGFFYKLWTEGFVLGVDCSTVSFADNPDKVPGTEQGDAWAEKKRRGMSDEQWRREQGCEWISEGGLVYSTFSRDTHMVDPLDLDPNWDYFSGLDFGWDHPFVHLWVAQIPCGSWFRWYIFDEFYKSHVYLQQIYDAINDRDLSVHVSGEPPNQSEWRIKDKYRQRISDAAGKREREELAKLGLSTEPSVKGHDSVNTKIGKVRHALEIKPDGIPGLLVSKNCVKTLLEFENYMYPKEVLDGEHGDKPLKKFDHSMDVIGDILMTVSEVRHEEIAFNW